MTASPNYARAALDAECAILASTSHGRNDQVNRSAFNMGQLIPGGHLDEYEVERRLWSAAEASGIVGKDGAAAVKASLRSGIEGGMRKPRDVPNGAAGLKLHLMDIEILSSKPKLSDVPVPDWTPPKENGRPKMSFINKAEPMTFPEDIRRHRYDRDNRAVRFKVKKADGWVDWYLVRRPSDGAIGWQAKKPVGFVPVPYLPPSAPNPFDAERRGEVVVWAEGEKDCDVLRRNGFHGFTFGSASDVPDVSGLMAGHNVVVAVDNDEAGRKSIARKLKAVIEAGASSVRLVQFPELAEGGDCADFFEAGGTAEDFLDRAERIDPATWQEPVVNVDSVHGDNGGKGRRKKTTAPGRGANDTRPVIPIRAGEIKDAVDAVEQALIAHGGLYQRANQIVFMGETPVVTHDKREVKASRIFERGESALAEDIVQAACIMKWDARAEADIVVDAPAKLVKTLKDRVGRFRFPVLTAIINAPTLRPDGSLLSAPGYDTETGLFLDFRGVDFPTIPQKPTRRDAERALAELSDLLAGFPFENAEGLAVALSAILTACVRQTIRTAPLHAFSAPVAGTGKSKLVDIASAISTGREAGVTAQSADEAEMEKRLGSLYLAGAGMISIDNCTAPVDGIFLCMALTQSTVSIRPLGTSTQVEVPTTVFLTATGNNLTISGDMTRRAVVARLDPRMERPELREFSFEPVSQAKAERVRYVTAALTIMLAYKAAGTPRQSAPLGSFEDWSRLVRDALTWLGCADPVKTMEQARDSDPKLHELTEVLAQWKASIGSNAITVRRLISKADRQSAGEGFGFANREYDFPDLREALMAVAGQGGAINGRKLGKWLSAHAKRIANGCWIEHDGIYDGAALWKMREQKVEKDTTLARSYADRDPLH